MADLKVIVKSMELAEHTLRITSNCNRYPKKYRFSLVDKMQNSALEIYEYLTEANRTDIRKYKRERSELQTKAITRCDNLLFYIELSMKLNIINVKSLGLSLNGKTQIIPFKCGISFLGFHHYMTEDGKYIRKINSYNKRRIRKKLLSWSKLVKSGKMQEEKFYEKYNAWRNHAMHGNCIKLCNTMDLYCKKILESE